MANRLIAGGQTAVSMAADCPGDWILATALQRVEAGQLHSLAGRPEHLRVSEYPWLIQLIEAEEAAPAAAAQVQETESMPEEAAALLQRGLAFRYDHIAATLAPSKQTATGRKGTAREEEALEDTAHVAETRTWRKPTFRQQKRGTAHGSAVHSVMQFIRYEACTDDAHVAQEIAHLQETGILSQEQVNMVNPAQIAAFFETPLGQRLRQGTPYIREFKFSILDSGEKYGEGLEGEQVLLQGVVDCALLEEEGITVLDFKTDRVTEETLPEVVRRYRPQVETYGEALSRIYEKNVKEMYLYFFHLNRLVRL